MIEQPNTKLEFLYTNIGRGHPFYLDGIVEALIRKGNIGLVRNERDVFELSSGLSKIAWQTARWFYKHGSSSGIVNKFYEWIRKNNNYNKPSLVLNIMGRDINKYYKNNTRPKIAAHPSLVPILKNQNLIYQHGEVVVPDEAVVMGADFVLVPTFDAASKFQSSGYRNDQVVITGLCIEPAIARQAQTVFTDRLKRIEQDHRLTGAFFSSGAEPSVHLTKIIDSVKSVVLSNNRAIIFVHSKGELENLVLRMFNTLGIIYKYIDSTEFIPEDIPQVLVVSHKNRREENILTSKLFKHYDFIVSPSHERTNWALGLGLPMFILYPTIGPFAPMNAHLLLNEKVAIKLELYDDTSNLGSLLSSGEFRKKMNLLSQNGWGKYSIDGFEKIADFLINLLKERNTF